MKITNALNVIRGQSNVTGAYVLDAKTLYSVIREESPVKEWLGMPFFNQAADVCLDSSHVVCVFSDGLLEPRMDSSIVIYDNLGIEIGKMIDPSMREMYSSSMYNVWLAEDFVLFSDRVEEGPVAVVMKPIEADFLKENSDIESASLFYPNKHTDLMLRERFGVDTGNGCSSAIIGINIRPPKTEHIRARTAISQYY